MPADPGRWRGWLVQWANQPERGIKRVNRLKPPNGVQPGNRLKSPNWDKQANQGKGAR